MKKTLQKSALALAVAAVASGAFAGTLDYTAGGNEIVLANEVFGTGSEETLVAIPDVTFAVDLVPGAILNTQQYTIKFTLNKDAVFGEDLSSFDKWEDAGVILQFETTAGVINVGGVGAGNTVLNANVGSITVDQGGAIGDNTVTFLITAAADHQFIEARVAQFRTKRLTSALARGIANPSVSLGAEFRNVTTADTDTDTALVIFRSQDGVALDRDVLTSYVGAGGRSRIAVASNELLFTNTTGAAASADFTETDDITYVDFGNLYVVRTDVPAGFGGGLVKKENGDDFDFNGSDSIVVTISSTEVMNSFSRVYLRPGSGSACTGAVAGTDFDVAPTAGATSIDIDLTGETTVELGAGYRLCAIAKGTAGNPIPESRWTAELNVDYFNPRYTDSQDELDYEEILRNGCSVTLFNVPNAGAQDDAFIRLTNISGNPGAVRAFMWTQDGEQIDVGSELTASLDAHATVVLHTAAEQATGVFLGDVMPEYGALTSGRHRIVLQGAFPACEALGLIRTPSGVLTNMTSTTYSGDEARMGTLKNGTSNTSN